MKEKRYYIAYGSNLNVPQMRMRCPHATILGTSNLKAGNCFLREARPALTSPLRNVKKAWFLW